MSNSKSIPTRSLVLSAEQLAFLAESRVNNNLPPQQVTTCSSSIQTKRVVELNYLNDVSSQEEPSYVLGYN